MAANAGVKIDTTIAYYEWDYTNDKTDGRLVYTPGTVSGKHLINPTNFEHGYITTDDSWVNYWRNGPNSVLGLRPGDSGIGWGHGGEVLDSKSGAVGQLYTERFGAVTHGVALAVQHFTAVSPTDTAVAGT